jgi:competence protein ComEC
MGGGFDAAWRIALGALAWIGGTALQLQQAALWPGSVYAAGLLLAGFVAAAAAWWRWPTRGWLAGPDDPVGVQASPRGVEAFAVLVIALAATSFAATGLRAWLRLADALDPALEGRDLVVTGVVAELPRVSPIGTRFVFDVEAATLHGAPVQVPPRLWLGWFQGFDGEGLVGAPPADLRAGERWRLPLRLKAPHGTFNPHGFDLELWLFEQGIAATGTVRPGAQRVGTTRANPVERLRQHLRDAILVRVADARAAGVLAALVVGDQAAIERDDWELFRATGVAHLMSISGLHVTMFAWLAGALIGRAWRWSPRLMLAWPAPQAARWGGLACAAAYALLAGWEVPAQRTVGMILVVVLLRSFGLRWPGLLVLLAAATAVVAGDPWALLQPGFWLSFVAVGLLMVSDAGREGPPRRGLLAHLREALRTQAVATVGLAPLSLVFFQQVSVVGFVANLAAIPLVTLLGTPLALLGMLVPPLWHVAAWVVQGLAAFLGALAQWPLATWNAGAAPAWGVAAGLAGGALLVAPLPWRLRAAGLPLLLALLVPAIERPPEGRFEAVQADIGQGTAVLVRTRSHLLVYDAGPQYSAEADAGARVLLPLLRARGERGVDRLVLSHRDTDHVGGAASLLAGLPVHASSTSLEAAHPLHARLPAHVRCAAGQGWQWDGVRFDVLHPEPEDYGRAPNKPNALSCVVKVTDSQGAALLLTGDIEAAQELGLVERRRPMLRSDWLAVPHHGSRTSSTPVFVDAVAPRVALVQAAYRSRFGHPAPDVEARWAGAGAAVVRSDRCGAVTRAADAALRCEREAARRYWHHAWPRRVAMPAPAVP